MRKFKQPYLGLLSLGALIILLASWGATGHRKINYNTTYSFSYQIPQFQQWASDLQSHAPDADDRKDTDPTESPKHYIDIDLYNEFTSQGRIPQTFDSVVVKHTYNFVMDNGILPWATETAYDTLRNCFQRGDWEKAVLVAADLGHYVADGHMPLHITGNYNGQSTGNTGIHSRYESTMIGNFISQINYNGDSLKYIPNVNNYIFNYLYSNYKYKDSILQADNYAKQQAGGSTTSSTYSNALWLKTKNLTIQLFKNASHSLAELIYTAWINAGSPIWGQAADVDDSGEILISEVKVFPNPASDCVEIAYSLSVATDVSVVISDYTGRTVSLLQNKFQIPDVYLLRFDSKDIPAGIYLYSIKAGNIIKSGKLFINR